jgi:hypothetical protein
MAKKTDRRRKWLIWAREEFWEPIPIHIPYFFIAKKTERRRKWRIWARQEFWEQIPIHISFIQYIIIPELCAPLPSPHSSASGELLLCH